ncbi:DUF2515 domain-containing protein [Paenibacillus sp. NPDC058071]|uniref:DUF2515 domain-containing protein n=1 Tax=Paenibacillus sp. NPDC058071 TaxID=3346326 RepID=UPI0036DD2144
MSERPSSRSSREGPLGWLKRIAALPGTAIGYAIGKWKGLSKSHQMSADAVPLRLEQGAVEELMAAWRRLEMTPAAPLQESFEPALIERIRGETSHWNRNNTTRTEAYRLVYVRQPELHWAMLAHLVSRNGGWNMTDLQGEWVPRLLSTEQREDVFRFLERANALIFQDAYPQLLLYEQSLREGRSLFHLLPAFGVSRFMRPVWERFWVRRDSPLLTTALIVNEQHYIEERVVKHPYFRENVVDTLFFGMQSLLQLNAVCFPYGPPGEMRLAGLVIERFEHLKERIEFGKRLYALLFGIPAILDGSHAFASRIRHSGSRTDYAPQLFAKLRRNPPEKRYTERLQGGRLLAGAAPLFSPELEAAWLDRPVEPAEQGDWFVSAADVEKYFRKLPLPHTFEITNEYGLLLNKIELAVLAAEQWKS